MKANKWVVNWSLSFYIILFLSLSPDLNIEVPVPPVVQQPLVQQCSEAPQPHTAAGVVQPKVIGSGEVLWRGEKRTLMRGYNFGLHYCTTNSLIYLPPSFIRSLPPSLILFFLLSFSPSLPLWAWWWCVLTLWCNGSLHPDAWVVGGGLEGV